jgi:hypothetical protein
MSALSRTKASAEEEARLLEMLAGVEEDDSSDAGSSGSGDPRDQQEEVPSQPSHALVCSRRSSDTAAPGYSTSENTARA